MATNSSPSLYADVQEYLDQAVDSARGIRVKCNNAGQAINLRQRMYKFRGIARTMSREIYPVGDPKHNRSAYDGFIFRLEYEDGTSFEPSSKTPKREGTAYVRIEKAGADLLEVEEL